MLRPFTEAFFLCWHAELLARSRGWHRPRTWRRSNAGAAPCASTLLHVPARQFCHLLHVASSIHGCFSSNPDQYRTALLTWSRASLLSTCWPGDWFSRARVPTNESSLGGSVYERTL